MRIIIENADNDDFNELAKLARAGKIHTFCMTDEEEWVPIKYRPMTNEEFEEYRNGFGNPDEVPDGIRVFDCPMPSDGQEVLVTLKNGEVVIDTFYNDGCCLYFEIWCDDGDVIAWQPLPEPYKRGVSK